MIRSVFFGFFLHIEIQYVKICTSKCNLYLVYIWRTPGTPLDELPAHCRAPSEHLGVRYLAQGYFGSTLKVSWHLYCYQYT